jgi:DNA polymerase-3 subunit delta'
VARGEIAAALQTRNQLSATDAGLLAAWSGGRTGWAFRAAEDRSLVEAQQAELDTLAGLRGAGRVARLKWAEERAKEYRSDQFSVLASLQLWQSWWRDVLLVGNGCESAITYRDRADELGAVAATVPLSGVFEFLRHLDRIREQLADNVNPQLAIENLVLHLP